MRWRRNIGNLSLSWIVMLTIVMSSCMVLLEYTRVVSPTSYKEVQENAAFRMQECEDFLLAYVTENHIPIEADDTNMTGLIGPEWTALTTTLGQIEAKRSVLNPNFAALLVKYFKEAGLQAGDTVAVGTSSSFPGLALSTLCAAEEMKLNTLVIASYGSSMYGGTRTELTLPKMLRLLKEEGFLSHEMLAVSPGGNEDHGESVLWEDARETIAALAAEEGVEFIDLPTIEESIARRLVLFGEEIDCFVNVGGASANSGTSAYTLDFPNGLVTEVLRVPTTANRGLMYEYMARNVPVINMLNVLELATDNGLPYDPVPMPKPGEGGVYNEVSYSKPIAVLGVLTVLMLTLIALYKRKKQKNA